MPEWKQRLREYTSGRFDEKFALQRYGKHHISNFLAHYSSTLVTQSSEEREASVWGRASTLRQSSFLNENDKFSGKFSRQGERQRVSARPTECVSLIIVHCERKTETFTFRFFHSFARSFEKRIFLLVTTHELSAYVTIFFRLLFFLLPNLQKKRLNVSKL